MVADSVGVELSNFHHSFQSWKVSACNQFIGLALSRCTWDNSPSNFSACCAPCTSFNGSPSSPLRRCAPYCSQCWGDRAISWMSYSSFFRAMVCQRGEGCTGPRTAISGTSHLLDNASSISHNEMTGTLFCTSTGYSACPLLDVITGDEIKYRHSTTKKQTELTVGKNRAFECAA